MQSDKQKVNGKQGLIPTIWQLLCHVGCNRITEWNILLQYESKWIHGDQEDGVGEMIE